MPVQQWGNAAAQTPAGVMQGSASAERRDIPAINGKDLVEERRFPICMNFTGVSQFKGHCPALKSKEGDHLNHTKSSPMGNAG